MWHTCFNKIIKTIETYSKADLCFIIIFLLLLFIPMFFIDKSSQYSFAENRLLARFMSLFINDELNYNFGKDYEKSLSDRFVLRNKILYVYNAISIAINSDTKKAIVDKNTNFIYKKGEFNNYDIGTIKSYFNYLSLFNSFCNNHKIKCYIIIAPQRTAVYPLSYNWYLKNDYQSLLINMINDYNDKNNIKIIYPLEVLKKNSNKYYVYYKNDWHWTDDGTYIVYKELMKNIQGDFPQIETLTFDKFNTFYTDKIRVSPDRKFDEYGKIDYLVENFRNNINKSSRTKYRYFEYKKKNDVDMIKLNGQHKIIDYKNNDGQNYKVLLLGTSFTECLREFIPYTFKYTKRIRINDGKKNDIEKGKIMKYYEKDILDYRPDILIFCISYQNIRLLNHFFEKE